MSEKIFCVAPKYLDEFKCDGSKCNALCCRNEWAIFVDAATRKKYSLLPRDEAREILRHLRGDSTGEKFFIVHDGVYCPFLGADNLCRIQKAHGEKFLSQVCAGYPRIITRFENFLEVALSPTCPVAAKLFLLKRKPLQFVVAEASEKILWLGANHILQGMPHDFAPLFVDLQLAMVKILQERRLPLDARIILLGVFLERVEQLINGGELTCAAIERLSELYASEVPQMSSGARLPAEFETVAENFLVNEIFLGAWPFRIDATITDNYKIFAAVYKNFSRQCRGVRSVDELLMLIGDVSRTIDHDNDWLTDSAGE